MNTYFDRRYPDVADLRKKAKKRMPGFAFDYLEGGCNQEYGILRNRQALAEIQLKQRQLRPRVTPSLACELLGRPYSAPFGIAPVGLQGLMWPRAPEILARAATDLNIPYMLSTVSSSSLERVAEASEGHAWFQLYNPTDNDIRDDLFRRLEAARYEVLVVTVDVPTFGFRPRDIRNGLSMPPRMTIKNICQMLSKPRWLLETALAGKPQLQTLLPYMPADKPNTGLAAFMDKSLMGPVDADGLKGIRDRWQGKLVIKGLLSTEDAEEAVAIGADAIVVSNHGARQIDVGEATVAPLLRIAKQVGDRTEVYMDSGVRSGPDIACAIASGADCVFLGRAFVYGVGALGKQGGIHTINSLKMQLGQVLAQLRCETPAELAQCLAD